MELQQFHSSPRVRTQYFKALKKLSKRLNQTWKRILPPDATWPRETCEAFFEPFAKFGVALYDAYAQELLKSNLSQDRYVQALNFDLKTLVCNQIYPYREKRISTLQDALDADARGDVQCEWTVQMVEAWHLFEHPRHNAVHDRVCREFIDLYGYMPELWHQLIGRITKAISRRSVHWLAAHAEAEEALQASDIGRESSGSASELPVGMPEPQGRGRKRGPKPDYETALRVAEIVTRVAPDGDWRSKWEDICEALDEAKIPCLRAWQRNRQCRCWSDCFERLIVIKAIEYRLEIAKQQKKTTLESFS